MEMSEKMLQEEEEEKEEEEVETQDWKSFDLSS